MWRQAETLLTHVVPTSFARQRHYLRTRPRECCCNRSCIRPLAMGTGLYSELYLLLDPRCCLWDFGEEKREASCLALSVNPLGRRRVSTTIRHHGMHSVAASIDARNQAKRPEAKPQSSCELGNARSTVSAAAACIPGLASSDGAGDVDSDMDANRSEVAPSRTAEPKSVERIIASRVTNAPML